MIAGMSEAIFAVLGVTSTAFCIWLTVRIVNRRERWAKRTAVAIVVLAIYPLSFGPASCLANRYYSLYPAFVAIYWPIGWVAVHSPRPVNVAIRRYAKIGRSGHPRSLPISARGDSFNP